MVPVLLPAERIVPAEMKTQDWLLPETTVRFHELPLEYNGFCGYTFVTKDGLLLPGSPQRTSIPERVQPEGLTALDLHAPVCSFLQATRTSAS